MSAAQVVRVVLLFWILRPLLAILDFLQKLKRKSGFVLRKPKHLVIAVESVDSERLKEVMQWCTCAEKISVFDVLGKGIGKDCNVICGRDSRFKVAQWIKEIPEKELQPASFVMEKLNGKNDSF